MMTIFQEKIGYTFQNQSLLSKALTHSSFANESKLHALDSNERLEFLGDAVLELIISEHIYKLFPKRSEGELTKIRSSIVCEATLAVKARVLEIGNVLQMGKGEKASGGSERDSILSDAFEAVLGAIYLDGGYKTAKTFVINLFNDEIRQLDQHFWMNDCKTYLQEEIQKSSQKPIVYTVVSETGPAHEKNFQVEVAHEGKVLGKGEGKSKKEAEQSAAYTALHQLGAVKETAE